ncbi:MAG: hypothetical protein ACOH2K_17715 [Burkholderiaceae bacterium]
MATVVAIGAVVGVATPGAVITAAAIAASVTYAKSMNGIITENQSISIGDILSVAANIAAAASTALPGGSVIPFAISIGGTVITGAGIMNGVPGGLAGAISPTDTDGNGIPDYIDDIKKKIGKASTTHSPIALDLNSDGIATTGIDADTFFDHDSNGFAEQTGWFNSEDGILVRDLDGNGTIDNGRELFGSETLLANGQKAANGYAALTELDTNLDGQINQQDAAYTTLKIWKDIDGDGYSSADELLTLAKAGVQSIATGYTPASQTDVNGNTVKQTSTFTRTDGGTGTTADIWFQTDKTNTIANDWLPEIDAVAALPDLQGFGNTEVRRAFADFGYTFVAADAAMGTSANDIYVGDAAANSFDAGGGNDMVGGDAGEAANDGMWRKAA